MVRKWHTAALPVIGTRDFDPTYVDFCYAWEHAHGGSLEEALRNAKQCPLPPEAMHYDSLPVRQIVTICWHLWQMTQPQPFYLSSHKAADAVDIPQQYA